MRSLVLLALLASVPSLAGCCRRVCEAPPRAPIAVPAPPPVPTSEASLPPLDVQWKTFELRHLSKEARWARARAEVGLSPEQESRLREAVGERDRMLEGKSWITTRLIETLPWTTAMGDSDEWFSHVDVQALAAADAAFRARVESILAPAQLAAWDAGGFDGAFGRRLPIPPPRPAAPFFVLPAGS